MKKRLLCIVSSLNAGGAETFLMKLLRAVNNEDFVFDFYVNAPGCYDEEVISRGGIIHKGPLRTKNPIKAFKTLKNVVKENNYNAVLKLGDSPLSVVDLIAAKMGGAKMLAMRSCNALANRNLFQKVIDFILRPVLNLVSNVKIAPSDLAAIYTFGKRQFERGNVVLLNNAVDLNFYKYDPILAEQVRREFNIENHTVIGHIGRFSYQKNHQFLLNVFKEIKRLRPNSKLILVGMGELMDVIKEQSISMGIQDDVVFAGLRSDIPAVLSAMDVFVFPSFFEGMPNTVIEAQATGLPCVVSDSITRTADITGLVNFLSIDEKPSIWAEKVIASLSTDRTDTHDDFVKKGYDIESSRDTFLKLFL